MFPDRWRILTESWIHILNKVQSSMYLYTGHVVYKSLTCITKSLGKDTVPWGTPSLGELHDEHMALIYPREKIIF